MLYDTYLFAYVNPLYFNFFFIPVPNFYYFVSTCQMAQLAELKAEIGLISSIASSISSLFHDEIELARSNGSNCRVCPKLRNFTVDRRSMDGTQWGERRRVNPHTRSAFVA